VRGIDDGVGSILESLWCGSSAEGGDASTFHKDVTRIKNTLTVVDRDDAATPNQDVAHCFSFVWCEKDRVNGFHAEEGST
jgi:hypothetical protein